MLRDIKKSINNYRGFDTLGMIYTNSITFEFMLSELFPLEDVKMGVHELYILKYYRVLE